MLRRSLPLFLLGWAAGKRFQQDRPTCLLNPEWVVGPQAGG